MKQRTVAKGLPLNTMKLKLKKLAEQTIVITGATSGIGLVTTRMAAQKGARLVLTARNEEALKELTSELSQKGAKATYVVADVAKEEDVERIAATAKETFGGFDTWVNNAAVSIYGHSAEVPIEDLRQLFEINFWGTVYGTRIAIAHYKERGEVGSIINMGSVAGNRVFPIQSMYSTSKYAVRGFTDGVRMELEKEQAPVVLSQIHPARIDTPYNEHATSYIDRHPAHNGMVYPPESVAEAILHVAEHPKRDVYVGSQSKFFSLLGNIAPRFVDKFMEIDTYKTNFDSKRQAKAPDKGNLYHGKEDLAERGTNKGWHRPKSMMVKAKKHSTVTTAAAIGAVFGLWKILKK